MSRDDPDVAELVARLGLRGMRYRSFGNRPAGVVHAAEGVAAATLQPKPAPPPVMVALPPAAVLPVEAAPPTDPPPPLAPVYPLLAAALEAASTPPPRLAPEGTLAFLGLRRAGARDGR